MRPVTILRKVAAVAVAAAFAAVVLLAARRLAPSSAPQAGPAWGFSFAIPIGVAYRYAFEIEAEQSGDAPALGAIGGKIALSGAFTLQAASPAGRDGQRVRLRLERLDRHEVKVLGTDLLPEEARVREAVATGELWFTLRESGKLEDVRVSRDASKFVAMLAPFLVAAMEVELPPGAAAEVPATWRSTARGLSGTAEVANARGARHSIRRRLEGYREILAPLPAPRPPVTVEGGSLVELDARGVVARIDGSERVRVAGRDGQKTVYDSNGRLRLQLEGDVAAAALSVPPSDALVSLVSRDADRDAADRRKFLETLARDFDAEDLDMSLHLVGAGVSPPHDWFSSAAARIELEPALIDRLARRFREQRGNPEVRGAVLDLLRAVGTPDAQRTLAALVADSAERHPRAWLADVQRLGQIANPGEEVRDLALGRWHEESAALEGKGTTPEYRSSALTLGSVAWHAQAEDREAATSLAAPILDALRKTSDPSRMVTLMAAAGNAGSEEALPLLEKGAGSDDPQIRAAAVAATRKLGVPAAQALALRLLVDAVPMVQDSALRTLEFRGAGADEIVVLCGAVLQGRIAPTNEALVMMLLERHLAEADTIPGFREVLERFVASGEGDVPRRARLALMALAPWGSTR